MAASTGRYNQTPMGRTLTDEEKREMRKLIPRGEYYPRTYRKGQPKKKVGFFFPAVIVSDAVSRRLSAPELGETLVAKVPATLVPSNQRSKWEAVLLETFHYLYDGSWSKWPALIPWVNQASLDERAKEHGCESCWDWATKRRFLEGNGLSWSLDDLEYLIDRYPDRQLSNRAQGIFIGDRPYAEIQGIAEALRLPNKATIDILTAHARALSELSL